jgi:hypothetical protein
MFKKSLFLLLIVLSYMTSAWAQETESADSSNITSISLPANAMRMLPESVPANVKEALEKLVSAGEGKLQQGESEVLVWTGPAYSKVGKATIINRLTHTLKVAGWKYEVGGTESGVTVFSLLKDGANRRALIGFYGESDGTLVLAWTELFQKGNSSNTETTEDNEPVQVKSSTKSSLGSIVGNWDNGKVSMVSRQNTVTGAVSPGSSTRFEYTFRANGTFGFTGLAQTQNFSCMDTLFNEKAGHYSLDGSTLTLTPSKNFWRKTSTCGAGSEKNHTLAKEVYEVTFKTNEYDQELICLANDKNEACYRRKN